MTSIPWIILGFGMFAGFVKMGGRSFWRLASRNSDIALLFFELDGCLIDKTPSADERNQYIGPFRLVSWEGGTHVVYFPNENINEIQYRTRMALLVAEGRVFEGR